MDLFIFGTLLHIPLLSVVSGDPEIGDKIRWGVRPGFRVSRVRGKHFPMIHEDGDGVAEGIILEDVAAEVVERLDFYEKVFNYDRGPFSVIDAENASRSVEVYLPEVSRWEPAEAWNREEWVSIYGELTVETAREVMESFGDVDPQDVGRQYPQMLTRAASRQRARRTSPVGPFQSMHREDVKLIEARKRYEGFFNVEELDLTFRRFDGSMSDPVERTVFVGVDCAIVLPYDPIRDRVLVVEQFRPGAYLRGDPNPWTVEPIAGRIDPGEEPEDAARREAVEEANIDLYQLDCVSAAYPSPGTTTEHFYVFVGHCNLPDDVIGVGGKLDEAEDIRSHLMEWDAFDRALNTGEFRLLPLLVAGHWLARNRQRLRAA
ncbi:MAG: NUDIX domain-containing protein [Pseudomonadota bacterium]